MSYIYTVYVGKEGLDVKVAVLTNLLLFLSICFLSEGCKKTESEGEQIAEGWSITGTWLVNVVFKNNTTVSWSITFTGASGSGTSTDTQGNSGVYQAGGSVVNWTRVVSKTGVTQYYIGIVNSENNMSGTFIGTDSGSGTWAATR